MVHKVSAWTHLSNFDQSENKNWMYSVTNAWPWWEKSKAIAFPTCKNWLNFHPWGQFEIKILWCRSQTQLIIYFPMHFLKNELVPAIIWKLVTCQQVTSKKYLTSMGRHLSLWYSHVILVSIYSVLTAVNRSQQGGAISGCTWAPKLLSIARKSEIKHWFPCGVDSRPVGQAVYSHMITKFSRIDKFS